MEDNETTEWLAQALVLLSSSRSPLVIPISMDLHEAMDNFLVAGSYFIRNGQIHSFAGQIYWKKRSLCTGKVHGVLLSLAPVFIQQIHSFIQQITYRVFDMARYCLRPGIREIKRIKSLTT